MQESFGKSIKKTIAQRQAEAGTRKQRLQTKTI